ncbi:hypothetical protein NKH61_05160 [Mesorhizobium sp. M1005]|uniref:hypothetical protein n=1 Tax=unclassified Mesorhizobium TaxID=325217 RepID=UPI003336C040
MGLKAILELLGGAFGRGEILDRGTADRKQQELDRSRWRNKRNQRRPKCRNRADASTGYTSNGSGLGRTSRRRRGNRDRGRAVRIASAKRPGSSDLSSGSSPDVDPGRSPGTSGGSQSRHDSRVLPVESGCCLICCRRRLALGRDDDFCRAAGGNIRCFDLPRAGDILRRSSRGGVGGSDQLREQSIGGIDTGSDAQERSIRPSRSGGKLLLRGFSLRGRCRHLVEVRLRRQGLFGPDFEAERGCGHRFAFNRGSRHAEHGVELGAGADCLTFRLFRFRLVLAAAEDRPQHFQPAEICDFDRVHVGLQRLLFRPAHPAQSELGQMVVIFGWAYWF